MIHRGLALVVALVCGAPLAAVAQPSGPEVYSIDGYTIRRQSLDAAAVALDATASADVAPLQRMTRETVELIAYLTGWLHSGEMPDSLELEARTQRFVLFENLVQLYADAGNCEAAACAFEAARATAGSDLPVAAEEILQSAAVVVSSCEPVAAQVPTNRRERRAAERGAAGMIR